MSNSSFIFESPKHFRDVETKALLEKVISYLAIEINDHNEFLRPAQVTYLLQNYGTNIKCLEQMCHEAIDVLEYSGLFVALVGDKRILNNVDCRIDDEFGKVELEWL